MPGPTFDVSSKTTVSARGTGSTSLSLGELKAFLAKAEAAGLSDSARVSASSYDDQRDRSSGWSLTAVEDR